MAKHTKGKVLLFARSERSPAVVEHLRGDGRAVVRDGAWLVLCQGTRRTQLLDLTSLRCGVLGLPAFLVDDLLAAVAGALALGLSADAIADGIRAALSKSSEPGRLIPGGHIPAGVAVFDLPATAARPEGGLLVLTPARNAAALEAWENIFASTSPAGEPSSYSSRRPTGSPQTRPQPSTRFLNISGMSRSH